MAKITKVSNSRFPKKPSRGGGRPSPRSTPGGERRISNTKAFLSGSNVSKPVRKGF